MDVFLSKFDASGAFQWVRTWGGLDKDGKGTVNAGELVAADGAGNVYIVGRFGCAGCNFNAGPSGAPDPRSSSGNLDAFLSKYDPNGNFLWAKTWGGTGVDGAGGLAVDGAGDVYAAGVFSGTVDLGSGPVTSHGLLDISLTRFSAAGAFQWAQTWGGTGNDISWGLTLDTAGEIYPFGSFQNTVDFDPGDGTANRTASGVQDAYLSRLTHTPVLLDKRLYLSVIMQ